jgi:NADH dehydrogenase
MRHVVIIGGGFGGITVAQGLKNAAVRVTVIDRRNHHLFQPLLYQVATAGLSPADIAMPIRSVLRNQKNAEVLMASVTGVDPRRKLVQIEVAEGLSQSKCEISYDDLIIATGSHHSYFGHDEWEKFAPGLKSLTDATRIRGKVLEAFERAELETDPEKQRAYLTFMVVGGGPTGVEMCGSIAELAHQSMRSNFRHIDPGTSRILLIEAGPRILAAFPEDLSNRARHYLEKRGVEIRVGGRVEHVDESGVIVSGQRIMGHTVIWAAGVIASPAGKWLGTEVDRVGRVKVNPDLSVPGFADIHVIGDTSTIVQDGKPLPGLAPVAMQQGRYVARQIAAKAIGKAGSIAPFRYRDKGNLATVGRSFAIADLGKIHLHGFFAWLAWVAVHVYYLISFRNRLIVLTEWLWAYLSFQRGARLITQEPSGRPVIS